MSRKYRGLTRINGIWHIDKQIKGHGRLCESTGTDDEDEAGLYLGKRLKEIRDARVHGTRPKRTFREAATRYLNENAHRRGIARDAAALKDMDEVLGEPPVNIMDLCIDEMHDGSFTAYREARRNPTKPRPGRKRIKPLSNGTLNRHASVVKCVLEDAATKWRDEMTNLTWLAQAPYINCTLPHKKRPPYPLSWEEQRLMFDELQPHSQRMSEFCTNTGARDEEVCALEWAWEIRLPELDEPDKPGKPGIRRSAFIIPAEVAKNRTKDPRPRLLVLNDAAQLIVESARGEHPRYVFTYEDHEGNRDRMYTLRSSGWVRARRRASKRYKDTKRVEAPAGFKCLRVHDLRHTFGRRLRATNVSLEDREDLLGHKSDRVTTEYSAPEIRNLIQAANQVIKSRNSPELTVLRVIQAHASA